MAAFASAVSNDWAIVLVFVYLLTGCFGSYFCAGEEQAKSKRR